MGRRIVKLAICEWLPDLLKRFDSGERLTSKQVAKDYRQFPGSAAMVLSIVHSAGVIDRTYTHGRSGGRPYFVYHSK